MTELGGGARRKLGRKIRGKGEAEGLAGNGYQVWVSGEPLKEPVMLELIHPP